MGLRAAVSPLEWLGKGIAFLFRSKLFYFSWWFIIALVLAFVLFSAYIAFEYPPYFFTDLLFFTDEIPNIVSVYYISIIIIGIVIATALIGRLAAYLHQKLDNVNKEIIQTMNELIKAQEEWNDLMREEKK